MSGGVHIFLQNLFRGDHILRGSKFNVTVTIVYLNSSICLGFPDGSKTKCEGSEILYSTYFTGSHFYNLLRTVSYAGTHK